MGTKRWWSRLVVVTLLALAGCDDEGEGGAREVDARAPDAGSPDVGSSDMGSPGAEDAEAPGEDAAPPPADAGAGACEVPERVVSFTTEDGITLEADWHPAARQGAPAVALFHMIPPGNDRTNYPRALIDGLNDAGVTVLNVDRRGAGGSGGDPREAYEGPNGRLDVVAALRWLSEEAPCAVDPARLALVGASNGTTSVLDYTVGAEPAPLKGLVFLTGGTYTENQNSVDAHRGLLEALPMLFVFSTQERAWSAQFMEGAPDLWGFAELDPGGHGTRMFDTRPEAIERVITFLDGALGE